MELFTSLICIRLNNFAKSLIKIWDKGLTLKIEQFTRIRTVFIRSYNKIKFIFVYFVALYVGSGKSLRD